MKMILPWVLAVAFAAGAASLYFSNAGKDAELTKLRAQVQQVDTLRGQVDDLQKQAASQADDVASMHKNNDELLRLRGQVKQLTDDKALLQKQLAMAQSQADRTREDMLREQARANQTATSIAEQRILQMKQQEAVVSNCINNLRKIDGAKQQWALEHQKSPDAVPTPQDLLPYLGTDGIFPQCPGGGRYTLNAVDKAPTCSIPGHVLQ